MRSLLITVTTIPRTKIAALIPVLLVISQFFLPRSAQAQLNLIGIQHVTPFK